MIFVEASLETVPTVGLTTEEFTKNGIRFTATDMSGQTKYRSLWERELKDNDSPVRIKSSRQNNNPDGL